MLAEFLLIVFMHQEKYNLDSMSVVNDLLL